MTESHNPLVVNVWEHNEGYCHRLECGHIRLLEENVGLGVPVRCVYNCHSLSASEGMRKTLDREQQRLLLAGFEQEKARRDAETAEQVHPGFGHAFDEALQKALRLSDAEAELVAGMTDTPLGPASTPASSPVESNSDALHVDYPIRRAGGAQWLLLQACRGEGQCNPGHDHRVTDIVMIRPTVRSVAHSDLLASVIAVHPAGIRHLIDALEHRAQQLGV